MELVILLDKVFYIKNDSGTEPFANNSTSSIYSDYSCNDWSGNSDTTNIVNHLQNFTYRSQPLSNLEIEIRNKLQQLSNGIVVSSVLALTLHKVGEKNTHCCRYRNGQ